METLTGSMAEGRRQSSTWSVRIKPANSIVTHTAWGIMPYIGSIQTPGQATNRMQVVHGNWIGNSRFHVMYIQVPGVVN